MEIHIANFNCKIVVVNGAFDQLTKHIIHAQQKYTSGCLIVDETLAHVYKKLMTHLLAETTLPFFPIVIPSGEKSKNIQNATECWTQMSEQRLDRKSVIIALGGGMITDLAGFVGSCYMRGIDVINIPTTLLGMVDAAIGGKTGINLMQGKNLVGTFHHPKVIYICQEFLHTLPEREYRAGLAEVIKYGVVGSEDFFTFLELHLEKILNKQSAALEHLITTSCHIKAGIVEKDEKELGLRALLNYGHTFGHAIESATHYQRYHHGEAVSIGMSCSAHLSKELGFVDQAFIKRQDTLCLRADLPIELPSDLAIDEIIELMTGDKKSISGKIAVIVAERIGKVIKVPAVEKVRIKRALQAKHAR